MDNTLTITQESTGSQVMLKLQGRLDGNNATYLDDKLSQLIQDGHDTVSLDMDGIAFLSSAGIRILVKQHKAFRHISGELNIAVCSENVQIVLDMVGMGNLFKQDDSAQKTVQRPVATDLDRFGYRFAKMPHEGNPANLTLMGTPEKIRDSTYTKNDSQILRLDKAVFGLGIGAFGHDFSDCQSRYGEYVSLVTTSLSFHPMLPRLQTI